MSNQLETLARAYILQNLHVQVHSVVRAIDNPEMAVRDVSFTFANSMVPIAVARFNQRFGSCETFENHNGTQYSWDFGKKQRVAIYARYEAPAEISLIQF